MTTSSIDERVITSRAMDLIMANEGEIQRLERELAEARAELEESERVVGKFMEEIERLRQQVTQRGARMQLMREYLTQYSGGLWRDFCRMKPEAESWFDTDRVPK